MNKKEVLQGLDLSLTRQLNEEFKSYGMGIDIPKKDNSVPTVLRIIAVLATIAFVVLIGSKDVKTTTLLILGAISALGFLLALPYREIAKDFKEQAAIISEKIAANERQATNAQPAKEHRWIEEEIDEPFKVNINGLPMNGITDMMGNLYGTSNDD